MGYKILIRFKPNSHLISNQIVTHRATTYCSIYFYCQSTTINFITTNMRQSLEKYDTRNEQVRAIQLSPKI